MKLAGWRSAGAFLIAAGMASYAAAQSSAQADWSKSFNTLERLAEEVWTTRDRHKQEFVVRGDRLIVQRAAPDNTFADRANGAVVMSNLRHVRTEDFLTGHVHTYEGICHTAERRDPRELSVIVGFNRMKTEIIGDVYFTATCVPQAYAQPVTFAIPSASPR